MNNNHNKKAVFFLGAGFSKAVTLFYPTLQELTQKIITNYVAEKRSITNHFGDELPNKYKENIEHLLTFLSLNLPFKSDVQISADDALYKDLKNKIVKYFEEKEKKSQHIIKDNKIKLLFENRLRLCNYLRINKICCITLNYDLLLEQILSISHDILSNKFEEFYSLPITSIMYRKGIDNIAPSKTPNNLPKTLKLHGSINWFYAGISQSDPVFCNNNYAKNEFAHLANDLQPMIVPPVMDKTSIYNHTILKAIWRQAYEELKTAKEIYIWLFFS